MSFMTSEEMTTGSVRASEQERKLFAARTRWWNSTGGGSSTRSVAGSNARGVGAIKAGDGGAKFRAEWPELDVENSKWMKERRIDPAIGLVIREPDHGACLPEAAALRRRPTVSGTGLGAVVEGGQVARDAGQNWLGRNKFIIGVLMMFGYVIITRLLGEGGTTSS